eukprot:482366-Amphidinium_carterae.1
MQTTEAFSRALAVGCRPAFVNSSLPNMLSHQPAATGLLAGAAAGAGAAAATAAAAGGAGAAAGCAAAVAPMSLGIPSV